MLVRPVIEARSTAQTRWSVVVALHVDEIIPVADRWSRMAINHILNIVDAWVQKSREDALVSGKAD